MNWTWIMGDINIKTKNKKRKKKIKRKRMRVKLKSCWIQKYWNKEKKKQE